MLSQETIKLLNQHVMKEMYAANLYLSMSSWCHEHGFDGAGKFLFEHAGEESDHAKKLITYLNETDSKVELKEIPAPKSDFKSLLQVFEETFEHEKCITKSINDLVDFVLANKDYSTFNFLQWYVAEQHEEEALFRGILDKLRLIGEGGNGLYLADQYIKNLASAGK